MKLLIVALIGNEAADFPFLGVHNVRAEVGCCVGMFAYER